ncbi:MAG: signal peptide peptidase SppA, partial [Muribaculaceae bacterium]|nr:signal peptide peptidase SppA [Muribaculaceae bacterium]
IFLRPATDAQKSGLVDKLCYEREMDSNIASILGKEEKKLSFVPPSLLVGQSNFLQPMSSKRQIAVLYAAGEIVDGGGAGTINFEKLVPVITRLAEDDNVKGLVLRVNSPGGAVFGSEQIGDALDYFQSKKKPLAVSMGDYAASGGYWISCCADRIFADDLTITGSIGIFGLIPNAAELLQKIGVSPQLVATNPSAEFPTFYKPMDERQAEAMQKYVERGYDKFVARVAKGRKMKEERVRQIGEGRVWAASTAVEIGLVDKIGSLQDAIDWIAERADVDGNYNLVAYPAIETTFWDFIPQLEGMQAGNPLLSAMEGRFDATLIRFVKGVLGRKPVQAHMPAVDVRFIEERPL